MSGISTGTGLISGIDTATLIDQLMAIEGRPRDIIQSRVEVLEAQKAAFLDVNSRLFNLDLSATTFVDPKSFGKKLATSSNTAVLNASAASDAPIGTYQFTVDRLVSSQQFISRGFADSDTTEFGLATTLSFDRIDARLDRDTELSDLNGGAGLERGKVLITDRDGNSAEVDLSRAVTVNDVLTEINNAAGIQITASVSGDSFVLTDSSGGTGNLSVANVGGKQTATSLGLEGSVAASTVTGTSVNYLSGATALSLLNDGLGVRTVTANDFNITDGTSTFDVDLDNVTDLQDVIDAINNATGNTTVTASVSGTSLVLDSTAGAMTVTALNSSQAAADLGIAGTSAGTTLTGGRLLSALNSKLLRNLTTANPLTAGTIDIGGTAIDLSAAESISQVIELINAQSGTTNVTAALNGSGNGLKLTHASGAQFVVADTTGNLATELKLAGTHAAGAVDSGDLDLQYINGNTRLDSLNGGRGVAEGQFTITDSTGAVNTVDLSGDETTLQEVIDEINSRPDISVTARINDTGDGLLLEDTGGGALKLKVTDNGSTAAADLGIKGEDEDGDGLLDGTIERTIDIATTDTLQDIVDKINAADVDVSAAIINDGSNSTPFRVSLASTNTGRSGSLVFDDGGLDLGLSELVEGRDAVVFFGANDPADALLLTSSTNALVDTVPGVSIDLLGVSDDPVSLSIKRNTDGIVESVTKFIDDFNDTMDRIGEYDSYNSETEEQGLLLGDPTLSSIKRQLFSVVTRNYTDVSGSYTRLSQVGITVGAGANLDFDEDKFREALALDIEGVTELFSLKKEETAEDEEVGTGVFVTSDEIELTEAGFGAKLEELLEKLTDSIDGTLTTTTNTLDAQIKLANDRIESLNELLGVKRFQLETQFAAMESALAQLQAQQSSLTSLASAAAFATTPR